MLAFLNDALVLSNMVGDDPEDKTPFVLWPSDHAGVWARIHLLQQREHHRKGWH
jgi:hypothetical protein